MQLEQTKNRGNPTKKIALSQQHEDGNPRRSVAWVTQNPEITARAVEVEHKEIQIHGGWVQKPLHF
jgi:hypothetical protein